MKISKHLGLKKTQHELDFVDVDIDRDKRLFLDPYFLSKRSDSWSENAHDTINHFFQTFIERVRKGQMTSAREMFEHLHEPNETCLGLSRGRPSGRGVGAAQAKQLFDSLAKSKAVRTGLLEDLEDCRLFIPNIGKDKTSDMTTNIIRLHLIEYTQKQAGLWGVALRPNTPSGFYWDVAKSEWESDFTEMLVIGGRKILLVPKAVVSYVRNYTFEKFHGRDVLDFLQNEHLRLGSKLVTRTRLKSGETKFLPPTKKTLIHEVAPATKEFVTDFSLGNLELFKKFKRDAGAREKSLPNTEFTQADAARAIDAAIAEFAKITAGKRHATRYHQLMIGVLEILFYPDLMAPEKEVEINEGRKRIDIQFDNAAQGGFFDDLATKYKLAVPVITCECKNYTHDVGNPEIDQLITRLGKTRGQVGLMLCRTIDKEDLLIKRCSDARRDNDVMVLPLTDADVIEMLKTAKQGTERPFESMLRAKARRVLKG